VYFGQVAKLFRAIDLHRLSALIRCLRRSKIGHIPRKGDGRFIITGEELNGAFCAAEDAVREGGETRGAIGVDVLRRELVTEGNRRVARK